MLLPAIAHFSLHAWCGQRWAGSSNSRQGGSKARHAQRHEGEHRNEHWQYQAVLVVVWREDHHCEEVNGDERVDVPRLGNSRTRYKDEGQQINRGICDEIRVERYLRLI